MIQPKRNPYLVFIFITITSSFLLMNCQKKEDANKDIFVKPPEEKLDSLSAWFSNKENYNDKDYLPKFYVRFNEKMKAKKWEESARLIRYAGMAIYLAEKSDKDLLKTHIDFINLHENDISDKYKSGIYLNIGILYNYATNNKASVYYLSKATQIPAKDYDTQENVASAYKEMSYSYVNMGKLDKALDVGFISLKKCEAMQDTLGVGAAYDSIAGIYQSMKDYENAEIFYDKAISNLQLTKDEQGVFAVYINKLGLYEEYKNEKLFSMIDATFEFYQQSKFSIDSYKIYAYSWYSFKLLKEKKIAEAEKLLKQIKPIFETSNEKFLYDKYFESAVLYEQLTGNKIIDNKVLKAAIPLYKENSDFTSLVACYYALKEYAIEKKDYKAALFYQEEYQNASDSLTDRAIILKTKELDKKYQTAQKEQKLAIQKEEIEQKNTSIALLIASIIGLSFLIFAYYLWQKQKTLKQDKTNSMNFTKQLLENTEDERKRIASDLHDSISHELLNLKSIFKQDFATVNTKIDSIINDIRGISRNLHPVMFDKIGLEPNIEQLVERIQQQNDFMVSTEINYKGSLSSADELQIYRIIQEALTNIIKYAKAHAAKITMEQMSDNIFIEIRDNGKGFNVTETLNSQKSFGLHNIIERSRVVGGEAKIKSSEEGTIITINIPVKQ